MDHIMFDLAKALYGIFIIGSVFTITMGVYGLCLICDDCIKSYRSRR